MKRYNHNTNHPIGSLLSTLIIPLRKFRQTPTYLNFCPKSHHISYHIITIKVHSVQGTLGQIAPCSTVQIMYDGKYNDREGSILNVSVMIYGSSQGKYCQPFTMPILFHPLIIAVLYGESVKSLMRANASKICSSYHSQITKIIISF